LTGSDAPYGLRYLIFTPGGHPDALQRRLLESTMRENGIPVARCAIITNAWAARQIITVISLFNPEIRAFAAHDAQSAMDYLEVDPSLRSQLLATAFRLQKELGSQKSLHA
jgi:hypothetical protein